MPTGGAGREPVRGRTVTAASRCEPLRSAGIEGRGNGRPKKGSLIEGLCETCADPPFLLRTVPSRILGRGCLQLGAFQKRAAARVAVPGERGDSSHGQEGVATALNWHPRNTGALWKCSGGYYQGILSATLCELFSVLRFLVMGTVLGKDHFFRLSLTLLQWLLSNDEELERASLLV